MDLTSCPTQAEGKVAWTVQFPSGRTNIFLRHIGMTLNALPPKAQCIYRTLYYAKCERGHVRPGFLKQTVHSLLQTDFILLQVLEMP